MADAEELAALLDRPGLKAHFVGIGGAGMAALAVVAAERGWIVSGCDLDESESTRELRKRGVAVARGHATDHIAGQDLVITSSAVPLDAPELAAARQGGVPVAKRAELTGALSRRTRAICISGTAGKTTTTAMCAYALMATGHDPSALVGAPVPKIGLGGRAGRGDLLVVEADEFDRSFLHLRPLVAVVTSVEADHLDYYGTRAAIDEAFRAFVGSTVPGGRVIVCADDAGARAVAPPDAWRYGLAAESDWRVEHPRPDGNGTAFELCGPDGAYHVRLQLAGRHNALNAAAAVAAGAAVGADPATLAYALGDFEGPSRRFELKGEVGGVSVYDDYAHHPTKVRATLTAARQRARGRVWCIFQPHTYHRTLSLFDDFAAAFAQADRVLLLDIYSPAGREQPIEGVSSAGLARSMAHPGATYVTAEQAIGTVADEAAPGDLVLTMGAGDVTRLAPLLLQALAASPARR